MIKWRPEDWPETLEHIYHRHAFDMYTVKTIANEAGDALIEALRARAVKHFDGTEAGTQLAVAVYGYKGCTGSIVFIPDDEENK
jgi:hypothetical protein